MEALGIALWDLSVDMGVYILFGLLAAGVLHQFVREEAVRKHLGPSTHGAVYKAALIGTPLPLCSCSVIPFAASLRKSGASRGATLSFLISTPITGIDSILATFGMFGWAFTLYRVASSVLIAIAAGLLMNRIESDVPFQPARFSAVVPEGRMSVVQPSAPVPSEPFSLGKVFTYGFGTLLGSFSKPLFWGLVIGAFIAAALPQNLHQLFEDNRWLGYLIAVAVAAPMYVCATASLPIAASLIMAGVSPGAAFVFLTAGPATNTVTMGVVKSMLGMRALVVYLSVIVAGSLLSGVLIDIVFDALEFRMAMGHKEEQGWLEQGAAALLWGVIAYHLVRNRLSDSDKKSCSGGSCCG